MGRRSGNIKEFMYGYKIGMCDKCTSKCNRHLLFKEYKGMQYVPVSNMNKFVNVLNIMDMMVFSYIYGIDSLNELVDAKYVDIERFMVKVFKSDRSNTFCYNSISHYIFEYLKSDISSNKKLSIEKDHIIREYIVNILWLFFGEPWNRDNKLKRLWLDCIKEDIYRRFMEMDVDDKTRRSSKIHAKTKKFQIEYHGKCQICPRDIEEDLYLSHIKGWKRCYTKKEKRDIDNTLLLCRDHDKVFNYGYISLDDNGEVLLSKALTKQQIISYRLDNCEKANLSKENLKYLDYHRNNIFKK